jgi:uncharacterized protein
VLDLLAAGLAAFAAGMVNAVAGGGTLITFPALVALGVPAVSANITNTVALCPGYVGGAWAQRDDLRAFRRHFRSLFAAAVVGGLAGSILLLQSSEDLFRALVPFLILGACGLLALQDVLRRALQARRQPRHRQPARRHPALVGSVFASAVYGGYFGAGLGIMLLAVLGLAMDDTLTRLNALKQALSVAINVVAALFFVFSGKVYWGFAAAMAVGALLGGNAGGRIAGRLHPEVLRWVVVAFGVVVAISFLV